jgi:hypothetical protein
MSDSRATVREPGALQVEIAMRSKRDRQCTTYTVALRRFRATAVAEEKQCVLHILSLGL